MAIKKSNGEKVFDVFNTVFMVILMLSMLYPFWHVAMASISDSNELIARQGMLFTPKGLNFEAFQLVFKNPNISSGYKITIIVTVLGTAFNVIMTALGAYVLSRKNLLWKNPMMFLIIFTMFFSGGMIPSYLLVNNTLHMGNSLMALIIPGAVSTYNLIVMRTSFLGIPDSLEESAKMDGATDFTVLFRIVLPLSMPVISVMILFYGVGHWNAWFGAMLYIRRRSMYPLQLILREILVQNNTDNMVASVGTTDKASVGESIKFATIMVATLPILFVYPFLQKYFVKGVMVGAVKG